MTSVFQVLDKIPEKKRGTGAVVCMCPMPGLLGRMFYRYHIGIFNQIIEENLKKYFFKTIA